MEFFSNLMRPEFRASHGPVILSVLALLSVGLPILLLCVVLKALDRVDRRAEIFSGPVVETQQVVLNYLGRVVLYVDEPGGKGIPDKLRFKLREAETDKEVLAGEAFGAVSGRRQSLRVFQIDHRGTYRLIT